MGRSTSVSNAYTRYRNSDIGMFGFGKRRGLRQWVLLILSREPRNGAEVMDSMEAMSQGWWRPSPGSIYPVLEELAGEGLAHRREDGRYELTPKGRELTNWNTGWFGGGHPRGVKEVVDELGTYATYLEDLVVSDAKAVGSERDRIKRVAQRLQELAR